MSRRWIALVPAGIIFASGLPHGTPPVRVAAQAITPSVAATELLLVLGDGVVGSPESAEALSDPARVARWEPGEWRYRITAGTRRGQTERESLAPIEIGRAHV